MRLLWSLLLLVLIGLGWPASSYAVVPVQPGGFRWFDDDGLMLVKPDISVSSCTAVAAFYDAYMKRHLGALSTVSAVYLDVAPPSACKATVTRSADGGGGTFQQVYAGTQLPASCPANSTSNGGDTCSCTAPAEENEAKTACVMPKSEWEKKCNALAGTAAGPVQWPGTGSTGCGSPLSLPSNQGCIVVDGGTAVKYQALPGQWTTSSSSGTFTGATCVPNVDAPAAPKDPCPNGQSGVVNGKNRCVPVDASTPATQTESTTTTNADGTTTTTSSSTSCDAGRCTTTTTTTNSGSGGGSGGGGTSTTSTSESIGDYCKKNPETSLCAKTNNGRGAETGDDKSDGECDNKSTVIGCMKPGAPPTDKEIPKATKTVGLNTETVSGFGASCPAPITFAVMGRPFTISYAPLCDSASWIKPLILLMCAFISLSIVYGALKGA